ncbi:hypothetical protein CRE_23423 [Caenorhabditis remanei]|uniref:F-box domain-containing protein n=1 Tax=Caenorhabditis remanei TaxID=31234 RepID=E3MGQ3_CAERE|nr:hypothetical protein CRE_23423 [Caenorhabditis remanei]
MSLEPTLLSLPEVVKDHLVQYLNYIDIARLRKTCHLFRQYLHLKLPDANIHSIHVYQNVDSMGLNFKAGHNEDLLKIEYKKVDEGCSIEATFQQGGTRIVRANGRNYLDVFCDDFTMLLKHQKSVSHELAFIALEAPEKRTEFWDMIRKVITDTEATTGKKLLLKKRSVILRNLMAPDVFDILPYFDASCLQMINITGEEGVMTSLDGIVELEHWRCLEVATLNNFSIGNVLQNITHLVMFSGGVRAITAQDVLVLKNKILHCDNMNFWLLIHENFNEEQSLYELLGPIFVSGEEGHVKNWNFRTPVENIVLEIEVTRQFMCFEMMPVGNVVENAVFIDYVQMNSESPLVKMPGVAKMNLVKYLDYVDIIHLKKTCRDLRYFVDQEKPNAHTKSILLTHDKDIIYLRFNTGENTVRLTYCNTENGYSLRAEFSGTDKTRVTKGANYIDAMCHDFQMLMRHQKSVMDAFWVVYGENSEELWQKIRDTMEIGKLFRVKSVSMETINIPVLLSFVPCFEPITLQSIRIVGPGTIDITGVTDSIQWKNAKSVTVYGNTIQNVVQNFLHFNVFTCSIDGLTKDDVVKIKDTLLRSPEFISGIFDFISSESIEDLFSSLGPHYLLEKGKQNCGVLELCRYISQLLNSRVLMFLNSEVPRFSDFKILDFSKPHFSSLRVKKTCRTLRDMITDKKPITHFSSIQIHQKYYQIEFNLNSTIPENSVKLKYTKTKTGCSVNAKYDDIGHRRVLEKTDYIDALCKDLANFLKYQKLETPEFHLLNDAPERIELWRKIQKTLHETSQETKTKLLFKAKCCKIRNLEASDILALLPYFDYKILRKISITPKDYHVNLNDIIDLPQWKHATSAVVDQVCIENLGRNILHMNNIAGHTVRLTEEDVMVLKNTFLQNPNFDYCQLSFKYPEDGDDILKPLGRPSLHGCSGNPDQKTWFFRRRGETGYVLSVEYDGIILFYEKLHVKDVPKKAKVME